MRTLIIILTIIVLTSCSSSPDDVASYNSTDGDVEYICDKGECGAYPSQLKCQDGTPAIDARCLFLESEHGCTWVGSNCKLDPKMEGCNL